MIVQMKILILLSELCAGSSSTIGTRWHDLNTWYKSNIARQSRKLCHTNQWSVSNMWGRLVQQRPTKVRQLSTVSSHCATLTNIYQEKQINLCNHYKDTLHQCTARRLAILIREIQYEPVINSLLGGVASTCVVRC